MFNRIKQKMNEGFTLVEILIVVVIIGILAAVAVPTYLNYVKKSRGSEAGVYLNTIYKQAAVYYTEEGEVPGNLEDMKALGLLSLDAKAEEQWTFDLSQLERNEDEGVSGDFKGIITATSTEEMDGGAGEVVEFNVETGEYCGYGHGECGSYNNKRHYAAPKARNQGRPTSEDDCSNQGGIWFTNYYYDGICISEKEYRSFRD